MKKLICYFLASILFVSSGFSNSEYSKISYFEELEIECNTYTVEIEVLGNQIWSGGLTLCWWGSSAEITQLQLNNNFQNEEENMVNFQEVKVIYLRSDITKVVDNQKIIIKKGKYKVDESLNISFLE